MFNDQHLHLLDRFFFRDKEKGSQKKKILISSDADY